MRTAATPDPGIRKPSRSHALRLIAANIHDIESAVTAGL